MLVFPHEAYESEYAVAREWMVTEWQNWIDPDSAAKDVMVVPDLLPLLFAGSTT